MKRLQRFLAEAGLGSRRSCERLIAEGRVAINGLPVDRMGMQVADGDSVSVDGKPVAGPEKKVYLAFYKPRHVLCTSFDPQGRHTVLDYFKDVPYRIYTVGRLDFDSEGLLLLTNDGDFYHALAHPSRHVEKEYDVWFRGRITPEAVERLKTPFYLDGHKTQGLNVLRVFDEDERGLTKLTLKLSEGRNRQIRRILDVLGFEVVRLKRTRIGDLKLGNLVPGQSVPVEETLVRKLAGQGAGGGS